MRDIPIKRAMLLWRPDWACGDSEKPDVAIVEHGSGESRRDPYKQLPMSACAAYSYWHEVDTTKRLLQLYIEMVHLIIRDGIPVDKVMKACFCIPEFRDTLAEDTISLVREMMK